MCSYQTGITVDIQHSSFYSMGSILTIVVKAIPMEESEALRGHQPFSIGVASGDYLILLRATLLNTIY